MPSWGVDWVVLIKEYPACLFMLNLKRSGVLGGVHKVGSCSRIWWIHSGATQQWYMDANN